MKLLFVISSLNTGGAQRALSNIVINLPEEYDIDILLSNTQNITYPYRGNLIDLGIREPKSRSSPFYQLKVLAIRYRKLRVLKRSQQYTACVSFLESANFANILTGRKYCKTIVSVRNYLTKNRSFIQRLLSKVTKFFYSRADHVVAVSEGVKHDLIHNLGLRPNNVVTIYNGYDTKQFTINNSQLTINENTGSALHGMVETSAKICQENRPPDTFTFITMGRCDFQKGQWHLIRVFSEFTKKHSNSRLYILGEGSYTDYYRQLIEAYALEDSVTLKGFVSNTVEELVNADVFVFPSYHEGFPNAMLEAMICGLPIIATDFRSGAREILAPSTDFGFEQTGEIELATYGIITPVCSGKLHPPEQPLEPQEQLLLEAMEMLFTDVELRLRYLTASKRRAQDFAIEKTAQQWCKLMENQQ